MGKKSQPKAPKAPDPQQSIQAQSQANLDAIRTSANINRYNEQTPFGSVSWVAPEGGGDSGWTRSTTLSPEQQQQLDNQNQLASALGGQALNRAGQIDQSQFSTSGLPSVSSFNTQNLPEMRASLDYGGLQDVTVPDGDYGQSVNDVRSATFDTAMSMINPEYDTRQRRLETQLANQGLPMGGEARDTEMSRFDRERNDAVARAAMQATLAGGQEQSRLAGLDAQRFGMQSGLRGQQTGEQLTDANLAAAARGQGVNEQLNQINTETAARNRELNESLVERNQPMNELAALLQGQPAIQAPASAQPAQYQVAPADVQGAINTAYQGALNNYNTQQSANSAKKGGTSGLLGTLGGAAINTWG